MVVKTRSLVIWFDYMQTRARTIKLFNVQSVDTFTTSTSTVVVLLSYTVRL